MGAPKQKWTSEEEGALRKGVEKYGAGRWRTIQKDPEFGQCLAARSNVDLKDKWRNMSVSASGQGSRERIRIPRKVIAAVPFQSQTPESTLPTLAIEAAPATCTDNIVSRKSSTNGRTGTPRYEEMIVEALTAMQDPNGNDVNAIASYIEVRWRNQQRHEAVPPNFRRRLSLKLKQLATQDKILKVFQNYKLKSSMADVNHANFESASDSSFPQSNITNDSMDDPINEASMAAAKKMAESEEMTYMAGAAAQEEEFALAVADESDMFFQAASIVFDQYLQDGIVVLR